MAMLRLDPSIPVHCPKGRGRAFLALDYSEDHFLFFTIAIDKTGEIWTYPNCDVRVLGNVTLGTKAEIPPGWIDAPERP